MDLDNNPQEDVDENNDGNIRRRPSFTPIDLNNRALRIISRSRAIDLHTLEQGESLYMNRDINMNRVVLYGQLYRIITPCREQGTFMYQRRYKSQTTNGSTQYDRIMMFRFVSETPNDFTNRLFYVMQNNTTNVNFFDRNTNFRDNGVCTIGTLFAIVNPDPIENYMQGIPMITTKERAIILQPFVHRPVAMSNDIGGNEMKAFVVTGTDISIGRIVCIDTPCSGRFCDRQRPEENLTRRSCGCFSNKASRSNVTALHTVVFSTADGERKMMQSFSSLKFMDLYLTGNMSIDVRASQLHHGSDHYESISDTIGDIVQLINLDGGWTVHGWGKKGFINDSSLVGNDSNETDTRVVAQEVTTHIVHIHPTNRQYLDPSSTRGAALENMKFDVVNLA